jgi:hypothetical protein
MEGWTMSNLDEIREDVAAFADDDEAVIIENDGTIMFLRDGRDVICRLQVAPDDRLFVQLEEELVPYREFIVRHLARLDILAERILAKRPLLSAFVDGRAIAESIDEGQVEGGAIELLEAQSLRLPPFTTRVVFITADAGQGKTWLLRQYQALTAERFLKNKSPFLFLHLDLQGRQLLRLSEALMGGLGDLRITGLWMPAIIRLLRRRAIVLAIDGFDELAAEQGGIEAVGALATLVRQMEGRGAIVAASRRTFFDTEDYLRRAGLFRRGLAAPCEFNQISLLKWRRKEAVSFLERAEDGANASLQPVETYDEIVAELGGSEEHPIVSRPFLFTHVVKILLRYGTSVAELVRPLASPKTGVAEVVQAFVTREVQEKWKYRETGEPYLTIGQHMRLLADVAEEMYKAQRDRLELEIIETIMTLLLEEWNIDPSRRRQVIEMVGMHVLLVVPVDGDATQRSFDHPEFRDYFLAYSLRSHLLRAADGHSQSDLARFLSISPLSDSTARYVGAMLDLTPDLAYRLVDALSAIAQKEWKPTHIQLNIGTLLPAIVNGVTFDSTVTFSGPVVLTSLVVEATTITNVEIEGCTLVNASVAGARWKNVTFTRCDLGELTIDGQANFEQVTLRNCKIEGVRLALESGDIVREFAPMRVRNTLRRLGINVVEGREGAEEETTLVPLDARLYKPVRKLLGMFYRTTAVTTNTLRKQFGKQFPLVINEVIPLMEHYGILQQGQWQGGGQQQIWSLGRRIEEILGAEGSTENDKLSSFWNEVKTS